MLAGMRYWCVYREDLDFLPASLLARWDGENGAMKVAASVKRRCERCKIIRRDGVVRVICTNPRHKQRQG